jgi:hypothetical protein
MCGAGLGELQLPVAPLGSESLCRQGPQRILGVDRHSMEKHTVAAHPASPTEALGDFGIRGCRHASQATLLRIFFVSERRRLDSTSFTLVPRERFAFRRLSRAASAMRFCFWTSAASDIFWRSLRRAVCRFIACERESETVTFSPVGTCRRVTAVETLFTCCPPGPLERENISTISAGHNFLIRFGLVACNRELDFSQDQSSQKPCAHNKSISLISKMPSLVFQKTFRPGIYIVSTLSQRDVAGPFRRGRRREKVEKKDGHGENVVVGPENPRFFWGLKRRFDWTLKHAAKPEEMRVGRLSFRSGNGNFSSWEFPLELSAHWSMHPGHAGPFFPRKTAPPANVPPGMGGFKAMLKLLVFLFFFFAAFFVPAWPLLLLVALLYLIAWILPGGRDSEGDGGNEPPAEPPPASPGGRWMNPTRATRRSTKPFRQTFSRSK